MSLATGNMLLWVRGRAACSARCAARPKYPNVDKLMTKQNAGHIHDYSPSNSGHVEEVLIFMIIHTLKVCKTATQFSSTKNNNVLSMSYVLEVVTTTLTQLYYIYI